MKITISIKTLNEEKNIARCISSIINSSKNIDKEIILIDSGSSDKTITIAKKYPIKIIQLKKFKDARCGIGHQISYKYALGEYILLIDGDMTLRKKFLYSAISYLDNNKECGGVTGVLKEHNENIKIKKIISETTNFKGFGMYRKKSIDKIGYLTNPYLYSREDSDLGIRLIKSGYKMINLPIIGVTHYRYIGKNPFTVLLNKFKKKYFFGYGQVLKYNYYKKEVFFQHIKQIKREILSAIWIVFFIISFILLIFEPKWMSYYLVLSGIIIGTIVYRKKDIKKASLLILELILAGAGLLVGLLLPKKDINTFNPDIKIIKR